MPKSRIHGFKIKSFGKGGNEILNLEKSVAAFNKAKKFMPGGVNSPVRSYQNVDSTPPFIARAKGSKIFDIDGNKYID